MPSIPAARFPPPALLFASLGGTCALARWFGVATQDDAFISFRYARNLALGHGLVYNPGEYVEGYTNLSWTLIHAAVIAWGMDPVPASVVLGVAALLGAVLATRALGLVTARGRLAATVAAALVALDPLAVLESVEGLETSFYMLLIASGTALTLRERDTHRASTALFALACLTRPDAPLIVAALHIGLVLSAPDWRIQLRRSLAAGAVIGAVLLALTAWRLAYYGAPLPNTFYAKAGGLALARGLRYLAAHALCHPALWLLAAWGASTGGRRGLPLSLPMLAYLAYVVAVGGDFKPTGRFIMPVLPLMAALAVSTLHTRHWRLAVLALVIGLGARVQSLPEAKAWAEERHANLEARRAVGETLAQNLPPDTLIAIHSAGVVPYYAEMPTIDMWGLSDAHIARAPAPAMGTDLAGHEKGDLDYVFARNPDLYLPEDRLLTLEPHAQQVEPGFPADFAARYSAISIPVGVRWLNLWTRIGYLKAVRPGDGAALPGSSIPSSPAAHDAAKLP